jgi:hypothetical protein
MGGTALLSLIEKQEREYLLSIAAWELRIVDTATLARSSKPTVSLTIRPWPHYADSASPRQRAWTNSTCNPWRTKGEDSDRLDIP